MNKLKTLSVLLTMLILGACGSGSDGCSGGTLAGNCDAAAGGEDGAETSAGVVRMGSGTTGSFSNQTISLGGVTALAAGGSVGMTVIFALDDGNGLLTVYTDPVTVTFSSLCIAQGVAVVNPSTSVVSVAGNATATYVAQGCDTGPGGEVITARANVGGTELQAVAALVVAGADVGSIEFASADPEFIGLKGTGGQGLSEQSTVRFKVVDASKGPVAGKTVNFALNTVVGGISFTPATAVSDANGEVQTVVQSGTVATSIRVTATEQDSGVSTQSSILTISTGIPHQDAFSLALETCNTNTWNRVGEIVPVTVLLSDRFQNPVPDGTAVAFTTEGGQIQNSCATLGGGCTVDWTSGNPQPNVALPGDIAGQTGGRVTIVATAIGEESFVDEDGDFVYDAGEAFGDLEERFRDDNENGDFDIGTDGFTYDFNNSGNHDPADGTFNGLLCSSGCSADQTLGISAEGILVMGTDGLDMIPSTDPLNVPLKGFGTQNVTIEVTDLNGNFPPAGTKIRVSQITNGSVVGPTSYTVPEACGAPPGPYAAVFSVEGDAAPSIGTMFIEGETPHGLVTLMQITVIDGP